jgi:hypothetical protein
MVMDTRVRRRLDGAEMDRVLASIREAPDAFLAFAVGLRVLCDTLLNDVGESLDTYGPERKLDPTSLAIPADQHHTIASAITARAAELDPADGLSLILEWPNLAPSSYPDAGEDR